MKLGTRVKLSNTNLQGRIAGTALVLREAEIIEFAIVILDEGYWDEGHMIYSCLIVAHPDNLEIAKYEAFLDFLGSFIPSATGGIYIHSTKVVRVLKNLGITSWRDFTRMIEGEADFIGKQE